MTYLSSITKHTYLHTTLCIYDGVVSAKETIGLNGSDIRKVQTNAKAAIILRTCIKRPLFSASMKGERVQTLPETPRDMKEAQFPGRCVMYQINCNI